MANLEVTLPAGQWYKDLQQSTQTLGPVVNNNDDVFSIINLFNKYLWFILGVVAMAAIVITGIKLVTAKWDEGEMKKATKVFLGTVVGVLIAIFSYLIVKVVTNIF